MTWISGNISQGPALNAGTFKYTCAIALGTVASSMHRTRTLKERTHWSAKLVDQDLSIESDSKQWLSPDFSGRPGSPKQSQKLHV